MGINPVVRKLVLHSEREREREIEEREKELRKANIKEDGETFFFSFERFSDM